MRQLLNKNIGNQFQFSIAMINLLQGSQKAATAGKG